jgi:hypothetical protein
MRIELNGPSARLTLDRDELRLLRYALERASFIDTPTVEQPMIAMPGSIRSEDAERDLSYTHR